MSQKKMPEEYKGQYPLPGCRSYHWRSLWSERLGRSLKPMLHCSNDECGCILTDAWINELIGSPVYIWECPGCGHTSTFIWDDFGFE